MACTQEWLSSQQIVASVAVFNRWSVHRRLFASADNAQLPKFSHSGVAENQYSRPGLWKLYPLENVHLLIEWHLIAFESFRLFEDVLLWVCMWPHQKTDWKGEEGQHLGQRPLSSWYFKHSCAKRNLYTKFEEYLIGFRNTKKAESRNHREKVYFT